tara:strand:- start:550 stop:828 length:279 start_codon:yes stop_codon:yes gene_type:complete
LLLVLVVLELHIQEVHPLPVVWEVTPHSIALDLKVVVEEKVLLAPPFQMNLTVLQVVAVHILLQSKLVAQEIEKQVLTLQSHHKEIMVVLVD